MSGVLLDQVLAMLRPGFTRAEVADVRPYAGEFSAAEVGQVSYNCPAILVTVLGWAPTQDGVRLAGRRARAVRMAAFVVTKHAKREARMAAAMALAEKAALLLGQWRPDATGLPFDLAPLDQDPTCENLYGRAIDAKGQALWLLTWEQNIKPRVQASGLVDLLTIEITDLVSQGETAPAAPGPAPVVVTEDVLFNALPPTP